MILPTTVLWLALNIYHESRGEPDHVKQAVGQVTINRARENDMTVEAVVKEPYQFSWRRDKRKRNSKPWETDSKTFVACSLSAVKALVTPDRTGGATHFVENRMRHPPTWTKKMRKVGRFGSFNFYKKKT